MRFASPPGRIKPYHIITECGITAFGTKEHKKKKKAAVKFPASSRFQHPVRQITRSQERCQKQSDDKGESQRVLRAALTRC